MTKRRLAILAVGTACLAGLVLVPGCARRAPGPETGPPPMTPPGGTERPEAPTPPERPAREGRLAIEDMSLQQLNEMELLEDIHFDFDRYELRPDAREVLRKNAQFLRDYPTVRVLVEGHCDERGTNEYNLALGEKRADAARGYLTRLGVDPSRLSIVSYGEERPLLPGHNEEAWAINRRAHFRIVDR